jgi:ADP-heptose:LPS heptosyltransferase
MPETWPVFAESFDIALDMQGLFKSAIVVKRSGAAIRLGYHWQREGSALFSKKVLPDPSSLHVVDQYVDVVRALGAHVDRAEFGLQPLPEHVSAIGSLGLEKPYVVINAGAGWATKRWPPESYASVIDGLDGVAQAVLIGGSDPAAGEAAQAVLAACRAKPPVNLLGKTSVGELIALIAGAAAHLGGDTGSTHIAAALGVPAVGLYSITRPERCCPYGQIDRTHYDAAGLGRIQPEPVLQTVLKALAG